MHLATRRTGCNFNLIKALNSWGGRQTRTKTRGQSVEIWPGRGKKKTAAVFDFDILGVCCTGTALPDTDSPLHTRTFLGSVQNKTPPCLSTHQNVKLMPRDISSETQQSWAEPHRLAANTNGGQLHSIAWPSWNRWWARAWSLPSPRLIVCPRRSGHTRYTSCSKSIRRVGADAVRETSPCYRVTLGSRSARRAGIGRCPRSARNPWSRRQSWFSKNTGCQGDAEPRGERGGLNDTVGFQFCELIIAGFFQKCLLVKVGLSFIEA